MEKNNSKPKGKNPIVGTYRNKDIRQYPLIQIRVSIPQFKQFIDAQLDFGLSPKQAIAQGKALCNICTSMEIKKSVYAKVS